MSAYVPQGTVFVVVIDPTVGTSRKAIVAKSKKGNYYVLPDNGLLTKVQNAEGIEAVRVITNPKWMIQDAISSTFHGRDVFSPVGAHLARGENWTEVGPEMPVSQLVRLNLTQASIVNGALQGAGHRHRRSVRQPDHQRQPGRIRQARLPIRRHHPRHTGNKRIKHAVCEDLRRRRHWQPIGVYRFARALEFLPQPNQLREDLQHQATRGFQHSGKEAQRFSSY